MVFDINQSRLLGFTVLIFAFPTYLAKTPNISLSTHEILRHLFSKEARLQQQRPVLMLDSFSFISNDIAFFSQASSGMFRHHGVENSTGMEIGRKGIIVRHLDRWAWLPSSQPYPIDRISPSRIPKRVLTAKIVRRG